MDEEVRRRIDAEREKTKTTGDKQLAVQQQEMVYRPPQH
jgi:hypothetical protein